MAEIQARSPLENIRNTVRPRRSLLYMPGSNARALEKARTLPADGLIMDLEDAVNPDAKERARSQVLDAVKEGGYGMRETVIRVNGLDTPWGEEDLRRAATIGVDAILLPKMEYAAQVHAAEEILEDAGAPDDLAVWCMIETPLGVLHAEEVACATPRCGALVMGTADLAKGLHCAHTPHRMPMIAALEICVLTARAAGIAVLDGVHLDLNDEEGFIRACHQGRSFGFDGKTLIHPKTIKAANDIFAPSDDEIEWSRIIIEVHAEAKKKGEGVVVVDGKLVESLHVEDAKRLVALIEAIETIEAENERSNGNDSSSKKSGLAAR